MEKEYGVMREEESLLWQELDGMEQEYGAMRKEEGVVLQEWDEMEQEYGVMMKEEFAEGMGRHGVCCGRNG